METPDLTSAEYWESDSVDIRLNPAVTIETDGLQSALNEQGITSSIILATSGTSGEPKLIVLSKQAMIASAEAVNQWCRITKDDSWLGGLSTFHVGGLGIYCRAYLIGSKVNPMAWNEWTRDGQAFLSAVADSTVTSLTPVHLHDLVKAKVSAPPGLRGVFIGGGALSTQLADHARKLGWPLWTTYGMTEASSQIATSLEGDTDWLPILPHWETKSNDQNQLMIKGPALMTGWFTGNWEWHPANDFYTTGDLVEIENGKLRPLGRADDQIKILGELVSIQKLEKSLSDCLGLNAAIFATPHPRRGHLLTAAIESSQTIENQFTEWNHSLPPFEQITNVHFIAAFPKTEVGKIDRKRLRSQVH